MYSALIVQVVICDFSVRVAVILEIITTYLRLQEYVVHSKTK